MHDQLAIDPTYRPGGKPPSRGAIVLWVGLAAIALAYIATLTARPDMIASFLPDPRSDAAVTATTAADVATLRATIAGLNAELAAAKASAHTTEAQLAVLTQRITELESRGSLADAAGTNTQQPGSTQADTRSPSSGQTSPLAEAPASAIARRFADNRAVDARPADPRNAAATQPGAQPVTEAAAVQPNPTAAAAAITADLITRSGIETGSITPPRSAVATPPTGPAEISFGPAVVKPAPHPWGLEIGRGATPDALRLTWGLLNEQNGAALRGLAPHYATLGDAADAPLTLIAGPVKSKAEASRVCKALQAKGLSCKVSAIIGEAL